MSRRVEIRRNDEGDGYVATFPGHDGAEIEVQFLDETQGAQSVAMKPEKHKTWEIIWGRGAETTLHHLSMDDMRSLGEAIIQFADLLQAKGGRA